MVSLECSRMGGNIFEPDLKKLKDSIECWEDIFVAEEYRSWQNKA